MKRIFIIVIYLLLIPLCCCISNKHLGKQKAKGVLSEVHMYTYESSLNEEKALDTTSVLISGEKYFLVIVPDFINKAEEKWAHFNSFEEDSLESISFSISYKDKTIDLNKYIQPSVLDSENRRFKIHYNSVHYVSLNEYLRLYNNIVSGRFDGHYIDLGDEVGVNFCFAMPDFIMDTEASLNIQYRLKSGRKVFTSKKVYIANRK